jgi:hypothetical protein
LVSKGKYVCSLSRCNGAIHCRRICPAAIMQDHYLSCNASERNMLHLPLSVSTCLVPKLISYVSMTLARQVLEGIIVVLRAAVL